MRWGALLFRKAAHSRRTRGLRSSARQTTGGAVRASLRRTQRMRWRSWLVGSISVRCLQAALARRAHAGQLRGLVDRRSTVLDPDLRAAGRQRPRAGARAHLRPPPRGNAGRCRLGRLGAVRDPPLREDLGAERGSGRAAERARRPLLPGRNAAPALLGHLRTAGLDLSHRGRDVLAHHRAWVRRQATARARSRWSSRTV